ncbi:hypothetical protein KEM56_007417 [Ascosphaera pollenicola]|nr:hypothetical protein KEM56_007417 [Ascosphaera pollenicola]
MDVERMNIESTGLNGARAWFYDASSQTTNMDVDRQVRYNMSTGISRFITMPRSARQRQLHWDRVLLDRLRQRSLYNLSLPMAAKSQILWEEDPNYALVPKQFWDNLEIMRTDDTPDDPYAAVVKRTVKYLKIRALYANKSPEAYPALLDFVDPVSIIAKNEDFLIPSEPWWRRLEEWIIAW